MERISEKILFETGKAIVGKDEILKKVLMTILAGGHVLLEDVPGVGKTTLAVAFSKAMGMSYKRVQFTPDTMASDIIGFSVYDKNTGTFEYKKGAVFCNFFLGDEINRTSAKTQAALLEAMEELSVTADGKTMKLPEPFVCIATQNPLGSAGTHALPDSQLDRFTVKLSMGYPTLDEQVDIVRHREGENPLDKIAAVATTDDIVEMKNRVSEVYIDEEIIGYTALLCEKTRSASEVVQGVSPRAVLALVQMAKAQAFIEGRDYVVPSDIIDNFKDVCAHRMILSPKARINKLTSETVLEELLKNTEVPNPKTRKSR